MRFFFIFDTPRYRNNLDPLSLTCYSTMNLDRPARLQVDPELIPDDDKPPQSGHTFNIWYLRWAGGDPTAKGLTKLKFRLNVARDSGYSRAKEGQSPICLFFARGSCYKGQECLYLHRPPKPHDFRTDTQDCFGRDKTADNRDDMGGVGLLSRVNKTLYVGGIIANDNVHEEISTQFLEFGAIDKIKVLPAKKCAFVSFRLEVEAQFTKEAMDGQSLGEKDILSVKWANEDMNPEAQRLALEVVELMAIETVKRLLDSDDLGPTSAKKAKTPPSKKQGKVKGNGISNLRSQAGDSIENQTKKETIEESRNADTDILSQNMYGGLLDETRLQALRDAVQTRRKTQKKNIDQVSKPAESVEKPVSFFLSGYSSEEDD